MHDNMGFHGATRQRRRLARAAKLMLLVVGCAPLLAAQGGGDPLFPYQWYLQNVGQDVFTGVPGTPGIDLNVMQPLSEGLSGHGVNVMVVDDGLEIRHPDLADRVDRTMLRNFDPTPGADPNDPTPTTEPGKTGNAHGTAVAGIIAATANNGIGGHGVAPQATLGAASLIGFNEETWAKPENNIETYGGAPFSQNVDIFNASYGDDFNVPQMLPLYKTAMFNGLQKLRGGLGALIAKSAGNEFSRFTNDKVPENSCDNANKNKVTCANANNDPEGTVPQVIMVAALNAMGVRASYSSGGSNILISGLGGEFGYRANNLLNPANGFPLAPPGPAMVTTDLTTCDLGASSNPALPGDPLDRQLFNVFDFPGSVVNDGLNPDCDYTATFNGTSASAPTVSGVIALMLEANPALTWRDVRTILMNTARPINIARVPSRVTLPSGEQYVPEPAWTLNAAGHLFDHWYGFGLADARKAVDMARGTVVHLTGPMLVNTATSTANPEQGEPIPQGNATGLPIELHPTGPARTVEYVQVSINMLSAFASDLAVEVISPSGTRSVLQNAYNGFANTGAPIKDWPLGSNTFNGERALGTWTVRFVDVNSRGGNPMRFSSVTLKVLGH